MHFIRRTLHAVIVLRICLKHLSLPQQEIGRVRAGATNFGSSFIMLTGSANRGPPPPPLGGGARSLSIWHRVRLSCSRGL